MAAPKKNIVILGGSYGGVSTAHYLLKHGVPNLPNPDSYQVILVSASTRVICRPGCPRALISDHFFPQDKFFVDIGEQFTQYPKARFRFVHGTVDKLDHIDRKVSVALSTNSPGAETETETISFAAAVIATGASTPSPLHGLNFGDNEALRESWAEFRKALPLAKSIVIAGGGPAGVETAGELGEYLNGRAGWFKTPNRKVDITVVTSAAQVLPVVRGSIAHGAEDLLAKVGVKVLTNTRVASVSPVGAGETAGTIAVKTTVSLQDGRTLEADLYIPATGSKPNTGYISGDLLAEDGRVDTDPSTLRVVERAGPRIYAIGDASTFARPAVHNILNAVPIMCANVKKDLLVEAGRSPGSLGEDRKHVEDTRETQLVPIGTTKAVGAAMGWQLPGWLVWLIKGRDYWLWTTPKLWSGRQWAKES